MERNGVLNSICQVVALVLITLEMNKLALCLFSVEQPQIGVQYDNRFKTRRKHYRK